MLQDYYLEEDLKMSSFVMFYKEMTAELSEGSATKMI